MPECTLQAFGIASDAMEASLLRRCNDRFSSEHATHGPATEKYTKNDRPQRLPATFFVILDCLDARSRKIGAH
jgi:hypothetical protein